MEPLLGCKGLNIYRHSLMKGLCRCQILWLGNDWSIWISTINQFTDERPVSNGGL